jgi:hypothetical protein
VAVAVTARRADRAPAAGPEFTFEPAASGSRRDEYGAARAGAFERGGAARSTTGAGFERRDAPSDAFERSATASSGGPVERDEPRTARGGFERDVATPPPHEQSERAEPHPAAARTQASAATTTAASTPFERSEPHPPAAGADSAAPAASTAFERSEPHPTESRRTDPATTVARAAFERGAP